MKRAARVLERIASICCMAFALFTLYCVFFNQHGIERKEFDFHNLIYAACGTVLIVGAYIVLRRWNSVRHDRRWIALGCVGLFVVQRFLAHAIIFGTGWDAVDIVNFAWRIATGGECTDWESLYLSTYPNNTIMIILYSLVIRIRMIFVENLARRDVLLALTVVNSLVASSASYLVYRCTEMIAKEKRTALLAWMVYCVLIGLAPWSLIPYSDSLALIFPILILFVYFRKGNGLCKCALIGALSYLGFRIKPTVAIVPIAILISELLRLPGYAGFAKAVCWKRLGAGALAVLILHISFLAIPRERFGWRMDKGKTMGMPHYLMMGLNAEHVGGYYGVDVDYSAGFSNTEDRERENLKRAAQRLADMGPSGYVRFLADKNAVNFHDGTFAWGNEGGFMRVIFDVPQTRVNRILKSVYYPDGGRHHHLMNLMQVFWMSMLLGQTFLTVSKRRQENWKFVILLCVAGITMFNLLFESRARYVYIYAPIILTAGCLGYGEMIGWMICRIKRIRKNPMLNK